MDAAESSEQLSSLRLEDSAPVALGAASFSNAVDSDEQKAIEAPNPCSSTPAPPSLGSSPGPSVRCFHETTPEAVIYFQIINLGRQLYVWISVGSPKLDNMFFAIQSRVVCGMQPVQ
jgi:hypothetical protein